MEKSWKLKTKAGHYLYGSLVIPNKSTKKLVIFAHGFLSHKDQHIFFNGARFFEEKGIASLRFDFYSPKHQGRHFEDTTISSYGEDLIEIVKSFKKNFSKIFLVGHSFGGTALLFTDPKVVAGYVFWDAPYLDAGFFSIWQAAAKYDERLGVYLANWGVRHLIGKKFIEEIRSFTESKELIKKITPPKLFITAGREGNKLAGRKYFTDAVAPKRIVNIIGADHNFNGLTDEKKLLDETWKWIKEVK